MEEFIKVRITGDVSELESSGAKSVSALDILQAALSKTEKSVSSFAASLRSYGTNAGVVVQNSKAISDALKSVGDNAGRLTLKPIKISTEVEKITFPTISAPALKIPVEVQKVNLPSLAIPPVKVQVEAQKLTIPQPSIPKLSIPVDANTESLSSKLAAATGALKISIDTSAAAQNVGRLEALILSLQNDITSRKASLPILSDTTQSQAEIRELEGELSRLQTQLNTIKPVLKVETSVEKIVVPAVAPTALKVPVEVQKLTLPPIAARPIQIPAAVDIAPVKTKLEELTKPLKISVTTDLDNAFAKISSLDFTPQIESAKLRIDALVDGLAAKTKAIQPVAIPFNIAGYQEAIAKIKQDVSTVQIQPVSIPVKPVNVPPVSVPFALGNYDSAIQKLKASLSTVKIAPIKIPPINNPVPAGLAGKLNDVTTATQKTKTNFTGLSRILQDLPFGFVAISNNLEQLLPAAGGAGLAISAITAALTFSSIGFGAWTRGLDSSKAKLDEQKKKLQEAKQAIEDFIESLDGTRKANLLGSINAQEDLASLQTLYAATQSANVPLAERKKLVDELQNQYPKYFKNITDEAILAGKAQGAYEKLSTAILQAAKARAANEAIGKIQGDVLTIEEQQISNNQELYNSYLKVTAAKKVADAAVRNSKGPVGIAAVDTKVLDAQLALSVAQKDYNNFAQVGNDLQQKRNDLLGKAKNLSDEVLQNIAQNGADVLIKPNVKIKDPKIEKSQFEFFDKFFDEIPTTILEKVKNINDLSYDLTPAQSKLVKELKEMADAARDFARKNLTVLEGLEPILKAPDDKSAVAAGAKFFENYRNGLLKIKIPPVKPVVEVEPTIIGPALSELELLQFKFQPPKVEYNTDALLDVDSIVKDYKKQFKQLGAELPQKIGVADLITGIEYNVDLKGVINVADLMKGLSNARKKTVDTIKSLNEAINTALQGIAVKGFSTVGDSIAAALSGGGIAEAFAGLGSFIGDAIQKLGEQMIALSPIILGIQAAIKSFNPALLLPAGIALTALGGVIKNLFQNSLPGHESGLNRVPYDNYVARLHKNEMVVPAKDANFIRGIMGYTSVSSSVGSASSNGIEALAMQPIILASGLRGRDAVLQQKRESRSQGRGG